MQNHLRKPADLMLQNATPLRKSAPSPPNSSDENVSCTAPATENASLQILFKCPTPAIVIYYNIMYNLLYYTILTILYCIITLDKVHNPLSLPRETTSEGPKVFRPPMVLTF